MKTRYMLAVLALARLAMDAGADHDVVTGLTAVLTDEPLDLIEQVLGASTDDQAEGGVIEVEHDGIEVGDALITDMRANAQPIQSEEPVVHAWGTNGYTKCRQHKFGLLGLSDESIAILGQQVTCPVCAKRM